VPLVREMVTWLAAGRMQQRNVEVGEPLEASVSAAAADATVTILRPDGQTRQVQVRADGDYSGWTSGDTTLSGLYTARVGSATRSAGGGDERLFAVHVNTAESDLAAVGMEELRGETWAGVPFVDRTNWQDPGPQAVGSVLAASRLHIDLLYIVLGLLLVETVLAWRFGHHRT
jgi:hypothetical protein